MLLEAGHVQAGDELIGGKNGPRAKVHVDGSIRSGEHTGSIHKVGAAVRNTAGCNGWTFWHVRDDTGSLVPIDALREALRREMRV